MKANIEVRSVAGQFGMLGSAIRLGAWIRRGGFDVIEAYGFKGGLVARVALLGRPQVPLVIGVRGLHFTEAEDPNGRKTRFVLSVEHALRWTVSRYDANSQGARDFLVSRHFPPEKFEVIPNGVDAESIPIAKPGAAGPPRIVSVARFVPRKRHDLLLRALALVREEGADFRCELIGYGPTLEATRELAARLGLAGSVIFSGRLEVSEIMGRLAESHLFVLNSLWEGMPGSVLEAMAAGLPVIGTDVNGTNEVVEGGVTGILVPPDDPNALAAALRTLLSNPKLRRRMGAAGRQQVQMQFSFERVVARKTELYRQLAAVGGGDRPKHVDADEKAQRDDR